MFGLIRDLVITLFLILLAQGVYGVEDIESFNFLVDFLTKNQMTFLGTGVLCLIVVLVLSAVFEGIGLYKITYGISKILVRLCQLVITFLSALNMIYYIQMGGNLLFGNGFLVIFLLYLVLGSSCWAIRVNDFNYHTKNAILPVSVLTIMSILFVNFIWPSMGL